MILNCARVVNEYSDTVGYLVVRGTNIKPDPLYMQWEYFDIDSYDSLLECGSKETFVLWSDTNVLDYRYSYTPENTVANGSSYTYLTVEESLYRKSQHTRSRVLLIPQAAITKRRKTSILITAIGRDIARYSDAINMAYPTMRSSMYDVKSGVFRFVIPSKDFLSENFFHNNFYCFVSTLCLLEQTNNPHWSTDEKNVRPADREYCRDIMTFMDNLTDRLVLPDLSDYANILSYQSMMNLDAEQMSIELLRLEKLYDTTDLYVLDQYLSSHV